MNANRIHRIVVTGSSTGIGRALTLRLLNRGHAVWGLARSDQGALEQDFPGRFKSSICDVSDWSQVERAATEILSKWPDIDGLVTCAGLQGEVGRAVTADPQRWAQTAHVNLDGTYFAIRALWPGLGRAAERAKVVCFSGGGSTKPRPNFSAYGVAKTGVVRLVETIAAEEKDSAVDINAIAPGAIRTRLTEEVIALGPDIVGSEEHLAAQRLPTGEDALIRALNLVEWLLSPTSNGISGRLISAPWDPWRSLDRHVEALARSDIFTLRRITPDERGYDWSQDANHPAKA